jgi:DDE domain
MPRLWWRYVYRAIDQFGQVIDVFVSPRRDGACARRFFQRAIGTTKITPSEVVTDLAPTYPTALEGCYQRRGTEPSGMPTGPQYQGDHRRACLRPESSAWTLRVGRRGASGSARGGRLHRAGGRNLIRRCGGASARRELRDAGPLNTGPKLQDTLETNHRVSAGLRLLDP